MPSAAVAGAGIFGASLARRLASDGWDVTLYERHEPGHERAASGDESRLIRFSHGGDAWYTRSAWRARELWRELEAESGSELFRECGVAWFGRDQDGWETQSERVLRGRGDPGRAAGARRTARGSSRASSPATSSSSCSSRAPGSSAQPTRPARWSSRPGGPACTSSTRRRSPDRSRQTLWSGRAERGSPRSSRTSSRCTCPGRISSTSSALRPGTRGRVPAWVDYDRSIYGVGRIGHGFKVAPDLEGPRVRPGERRPDARRAQRGDRARLRGGAVSGPRRRAARVLEGLSVLADARHELPPGAAPGARRQLDLRRRVGPRLQARPRPRRVRGAGDRRRGGARRAVRVRPEGPRAEPPNCRTYLTVMKPFMPMLRWGVQ